MPVNYQQKFLDSMGEVDKLASTPDLIRQFAVDVLVKSLETPGITHSVASAIRNAKTALENIRDQSIANRYSAIYSQMCVLASSALEVTVKEYFENLAFHSANLNKSNLSDLKITLREVVENDLRFGGKLGKLILDKDNSINFQDLGSIKRVFEKYFERKIVRFDSELAKKANFYLQARHVLVHKGGVVDQSFLDSNSKYQSNIKNYALGERIKLDVTDWVDIRASFLHIIESVVAR